MRSFCLHSYLGDVHNSVHWVIAKLYFISKDDTVNTILDRVQDIISFSSLRSGGVKHRLKCLVKTENRFSHDICFIYHPFEGNESFFRRKFEVKACLIYHDGISFSQDLFVVLNSLC